MRRWSAARRRRASRRRRARPGSPPRAGPQATLRRQVGPSSPLSPCTYSATYGSRTSGRSAPAATGMSPRPANSSTRRAFAVVFSSVWLPATVVTPSRSTSGLASASRIAIASSWRIAVDQDRRRHARVQQRIELRRGRERRLRAEARRGEGPAAHERSSASPRGRPSSRETARHAVNASPAAVPSTASTGGGFRRARPPSALEQHGALGAEREARSARRARGRAPRLVAVDDERVDAVEQLAQERPGGRGVQARKPAASAQASTTAKRNLELAEDVAAGRPDRAGRPFAPRRPIWFSPSARRG